MSREAPEDADESGDNRQGQPVNDIVAREEAERNVDPNPPGDEAERPGQSSGSVAVADHRVEVGAPAAQPLRMEIPEPVPDFNEELRDPIGGQMPVLWLGQEDFVGPRPAEEE